MMAVVDDWIEAYQVRSSFFVCVRVCVYKSFATFITNFYYITVI